MAAKGEKSASDGTEYHATDAGASKTYPLQCSSLRKNGHVLIKGKPCKIVEMSTSKTGKHGHAKVHMVGIDIFTGKKLEDICPSTHNMDVPHVYRNDYQLIDLDEEGYMTLMEQDGGKQRTDIKVDVESEIGKEIKGKFDDDIETVVTILKAMDSETAVGTKTQTK